MERAVLRIHTRRGIVEGESRLYVKRLRRQMNQALPDAQVKGWEDFLPSVVEMRDSNDRHVVAAALAGRADVIVTFNLKDFSSDELPGELFSLSPDEFLLDVLDLYPETVMRVLEVISSRSGRKGPKWTVEDLLGRLDHESLHEFVRACRKARREV